MSTSPDDQTIVTPHTQIPEDTLTFGQILCSQTLCGGVLILGMAFLLTLFLHPQNPPRAFLGFSAYIPHQCQGVGRGVGRRVRREVGERGSVFNLNIASLSS